MLVLQDVLKDALEIHKMSIPTLITRPLQPVQELVPHLNARIKPERYSGPFRALFKAMISCPLESPPSFPVRSRDRGRVVSGYRTNHDVETKLLDGYLTTFNLSNNRPNSDSNHQTQVRSQFPDPKLTEYST